MNSLWLILLLLWSVSVFGEDKSVFDGDCGLGRKVSGYTFDYGGQRFSMPKLGVLNRAGKEIYSRDGVYDWWTNYSGAELYQFADFLLLRVWSRDCIDIYQGEIFLISPSGELLLQQYEWTSNWKGGFYIDDGQLAYWSEYFCYIGNSSNRDTFIYRLADSKNYFYRQAVDPEGYCSDSYIKNFENLVLSYKKPELIEKIR